MRWLLLNRGSMSLTHIIRSTHDEEILSDCELVHVHHIVSSDQIFFSHDNIIRSLPQNRENRPCGNLHRRMTNWWLHRCRWFIRLLGCILHGTKVILVVAAVSQVVTEKTERTFDGIGDGFFAGFVEGCAF